MPATAPALSIKPFQLVKGLTGTNDVDPNSLQFLQSGPASCRKRRADLQRIDLSKCSKKLIGDSSESLNGISNNGNEADGLQTPDSDDCLSNSGTDLEDGEENLKRLRLRSHSQSSFSSTVDGTELVPPSTKWHGSQERLLFIGLPDALESNSVRKIQPNLAELEGSSGVSSSSRHAQSSCGLLLEDKLHSSKFELVGDGRNCKAVEIDNLNNVVWHCQIVKQDEFCQIVEIMARMQEAAVDYEEEEFVMISNMLLPLDQLRIIRSPQRPGLVYMLLPDHHGTLHQLLEENELCCSGGPARICEERAQPILMQVAILLNFCHRIGLYFRDFRLRKFVFIDGEKTKIRVNNVLDLYLAPEAKTDSIISREFIPAYVAPELIDKKNEQYGGKAADIWAFGVLIFTLLNGRYPFFESSPSPIALLRRIRAHRFSFPIHKTISEPARWLIHSLLSPKPMDRPMTGQILQAHWFRNPLFDKLAEQPDPKGQNGICERTKMTSPPTTAALFLLTSPGPVSTVNSSLRSSPPAGLVPPSRQLSPITTAQLDINNTEGDRPELMQRDPRIMTHPTLNLDQQQPTTSLMNQTRVALSLRTISESRQQPQNSEIGIHRRGQPPAFIPISAFPDSSMTRRFSSDRRFNAHGRHLMMRLMPTGINNIGIITHWERGMARKKLGAEEEAENGDQTVPESTINFAVEN